MFIRIYLEASRIQARTSAYSYGGFSPSTPIGFAHAFCRNAGLEQKGGVMLVVHQYRNRGVTKQSGGFDFQMLRSSARDIAKRTQTDIPLCDATVSMIFECEDVGETAETISNYEGIVDCMRFGGGVITPAGTPGRPTREVHTFNSMEDALKFIRPGFVMVGRETVIDLEAPIASLLNQLQGRDAKGQVQEGSKGWLTPTLLGYRLLEPPRERLGARFGYQHAFADPLLGIVEYISVRRRQEIISRGVWQLYQKDEIFLYATTNPF